MAQLVWYIWCRVAKKISQLAARTNLSTVVGDAENEGERKKKISNVMTALNCSSVVVVRFHHQHATKPDP